MRINEFIEYMAKSINRTLKEEQILALAQKQLEVKKYIPIKEKKALVNKIIVNSSYYEEGVLKIDSIDCYMYFTMLTIDVYTNLEIDNIESAFDMLSESGLLPVVVMAIGQEYDDVQTFLNMKRDEILSADSIEAQFGKLFNNILTNVDDLKNALIEVVNDLDINKTDVIKMIKMFVQQ